jgi:predicted O-methyltransferase YrrM
MAQHTEVEAALLRRYARGVKHAVEIGVAEGGSACEIRHVIDPQGTLYLIDPYPPGMLCGMSMTRTIARRLVNNVRRGSVIWDQRYSHEAAHEWLGEVDFLFIDGDHTYDAVRRDWQDWAPHVRRGGIVAMHDAFVTADGRVGAEDGPALVIAEATKTGDWELVDGADSLAILRRVNRGDRGDPPQSCT